ncbi:Lipoamide acyltransferase component of branched-chain alpha-keto acid dehydrogenase isoform 2 [Hibiscus syriacus]|uniref:Dihydrolipoamide acetyltransferase component of pyruvate dehydrogenase complex n=1 Tax=Hibiscus syriacus TaxID=106335 RepID=A0A6A3CJE7_HIBSY|nr:Lipoamide acyltransferase component of branched-chain alpha-keto acid dehydrogenase isoform 2 [Hibiscus syriacus]
MIGRMVLQKRVWNNGHRWLFPSSAPCPVPASETMEYCKRQLSTHVFASFSSPVNNSVKFFSSNAVADLPTNGIVDVPLAQTSEGIAECELLKWFVHGGDEVDEFQPLCEIQNDKATIEITSRHKGRVVQIVTKGELLKFSTFLEAMKHEDGKGAPFQSWLLLSLPSSDMTLGFLLILSGSHNIGIAMATPYGLVVQNIKNVQSLSILEITKELSRLQQLALDNKLSPNDISGGTITLSNIGAIGGKFGAPIVNLAEVAIIAMGRIQKLPRVADDGDIYSALIMTANIVADHRVMDGATVTRFCN